MRKFTEPTARNLLRRPMVLGVPFPGLLGLAFGSLFIFTLGGGSPTANGAAIVFGLLGYSLLRISSRFAKRGWEESFVYFLERTQKPKTKAILSLSEAGDWPVHSPDTKTETDLIRIKDETQERLQSLRAGQSLALCLAVTKHGAQFSEFRCQGQANFKDPLQTITNGTINDSDRVYSLFQLPVVSDPLWLFSQLRKIVPPYKVLIRLQGTDFKEIKRRLEGARRSNSDDGNALRDIDAAVSFEEASLVLQGLSRGDDTVCEASLVIVSPTPLDIDTSLFVEELATKTLAIVSSIGFRKRFHRSHLVRSCTASDLIPNIGDAVEPGVAILSTVRGQPLYFSPQDSRLEALHWLVVGASGSGKSFFTGLVLKRMIEQGSPMSVLFVDHNRSFRRLVRCLSGRFEEPKSYSEVEKAACELFEVWNQEGSVSGIELSDLDLSEKKIAIHALLSRFETFLRFRDSTHPIYLVLDECWNFMRDEPVLVQRAFREFRKLNGAVIAITQSLSDFLTDESGQSICQNAPIRILLRQGEDVSLYQGILGLNPIETSRLSRLRQQKGVFSECLVKTPFLSRIGRLYPTQNEHELLRTDNIRAELISEALHRKAERLVTEAK